MDGSLFYRDGSFLESVLEAIASLQYYCIAAIALLYYDFFLTIDQEIERIWKQKLSIVSCIFVLNRYLALLGYIPIAFFIFNSPDNDKAYVCTIFSRFPGALSTITQCFVVVLLVMRVYALHQRAKWVLWVSVPLGTMTIVICAWGFFQIKAVNLSFGRQAIFRACIPSNLKSKTIFKASWFINGAFDTTVFVLTVRKTYLISKAHREARVQSELAELLARDGSMFYGVLAAANIINVVFFLMNDAQNKNSFFEESAGNNSVLTHTLTSTLLSRLILNLRGAGQREETPPTRMSTRLSIAPPEDVALVPASTFSKATTISGSDQTASSSGSTAVGSEETRKDAIRRTV